jgi:hypothetical protein
LFYKSIIDHEATLEEFRQAVVLHRPVALGDDLLPTAIRVAHVT